MRWNWQWDDKQSGGKPWPYDRADLRAGVICLGSYSRWTDASLLRDGVDPLRPIHAWMYQARYIDGVYNEDPDEWFATVAEAKAFVEAEANKMLAAAISLGVASLPTPEQTARVVMDALAEAMERELQWTEIEAKHPARFRAVQDAVCGALAQSNARPTPPSDHGAAAPRDSGTGG